MRSTKQADPDPVVTQLPENKRQKFHRIAAGRMNRIISSLDKLRTLADRSAYDPTEEDVAAMFRAIDEKVLGLRTLYRATARKQTDFKFDGH
jgi:hypothetical protein